MGHGPGFLTRPENKGDQSFSDGAVGWVKDYDAPVILSSSVSPATSGVSMLTTIVIRSPSCAEGVTLTRLTTGNGLSCSCPSTPRPDWQKSAMNVTQRTRRIRQCSHRWKRNIRAVNL